jgi:hypothetical protein
MANFVFYRGDDVSLVDGLRRAAATLWGDVREIRKDSFSLFFPESDSGDFAETADNIGMVSGYVRADGVGHCSHEGVSMDYRHNQLFLDEVAEENHWPLGSGWTGSFGAVVYSARSKSVTLCNDLVGFMPVYYSLFDKGVVGGTSLIILGRALRRGVDAVGVLQRVTPPYCNYGRRTLINGISRPLPGEWITFTGNAREPKSIFDNSLCDGLLSSDVETAARKVWDCLQQEISLAVGMNDRICLALSGGWDSRIVLGGIAHRGDTIECFTYGNKDAYEPRIARRCADAVHARHECFPVEGGYFPSRAEFERLVQETEAFEIPDWFGMISSLRGRKQEKDILLLGDHSQAIDGRYMTTVSSRSARRKAFLNGMLGHRERFQPATTEQFEEWKRGKTREIVSSMMEGASKLSPALRAACTDARIAQETAADLELSTDRVRENMPPFVPMFEELFLWFHKTRFTLSSQNLLLASISRPMSPVMSMRSLRLLSTLHPHLRLRRRLMDAIARLPEFDRLGRIPSAQIPWLSGRAPASIRELLWGLRSGLDQVLMRRVMKTKDPTKRQRVLPSLDYLKEYRREHVVPTVQSWFSGRWVKGDSFVEVTKKRAEMTSWPYINLDITSPANVSILLDLASVKNENPVSTS